MRRLLLLLCISACRPSGPGIEVHDVPWDFPDAVHLGVGAKLKSDVYWGGQAEALVRATTAVIQSPRFHDVVLDRKDLYNGPGGFEVKPGLLLDAYVSRETNGWHTLDSVLHLQILDEDVAGVTGPAKDGERTVMTVNIQPYVLRRWASASVELQGCALNTVAHELTHTIVNGDGTASVFTDTGVAMWFHRWFGGNDALVSYGVGTLAECVYLESAGGQTRDAFKDCVEARSMSSFAGCDTPKASDGLERLVE